MIQNIPGSIVELGVFKGASLFTFAHFLEIFNHGDRSRKIFGFDTFEGFPEVDSKDGMFAKAGDYKSFDGYENILDEILGIHEQFSPISHIKKFELIKGDASQTINQWVDNNPHAIIAMAIFDMDIYQPTRDVLEKIIPRLTKGSLLVFDELNCAHFPGETTAVQEILGLNNLTLRRFPHQSYCAWTVFGG